MYRYLLCISILMLFACQGTKTMPGEFEGQMINFGSGGGFTGAATSFCLLENGVIYKKEGIPGKDESAYEKVTKISKADREAIFEQAAQAAEMNGLNEPGNMYAFIECEMNEGKMNFTWEDGAEPADHPMVQLYQQLLQHIKSN